MKLLHPRHVVAFRRGQKNDYNDAGAICEATRRPDVRSERLESPAQQDSPDAPSGTRRVSPATDGGGESGAGVSSGGSSGGGGREYIRKPPYRASPRPAGALSYLCSYLPHLEGVMHLWGSGLEWGDEAERVSE